MALNRTSWIGSVTDFGTTQLYPLGTEREALTGGSSTVTTGSKRYRYVLNGEAATAFVAGNVIQRKSATNSAGTGIVSASTDSYAGLILGVSVSAIPAAQYGWVQIKGYSPSLVTDGGTSSGDPLGTKGGTTAGSVYTVTKGLGTDFAYALADDSGTAVNAILNIP